MKHTAGKWYFEQDGREPYVVCDNYHLGRICTMEGISHEARANAKMAAAAPDLNRALKNLMAFVYDLPIEKSEKLIRLMSAGEMAIRKSEFGG